MVRPLLGTRDHAPPPPSADASVAAFSGWNDDDADVVEGPRGGRGSAASAVDAIITMDESGSIHSANDAVRRVLGWTPEELIGRSLGAIVPAASGPIVAGCEGRCVCTAAVRKGGALVSIELLVSGTRGAGCERPVYVGVIHDISGDQGTDRGCDEERTHWQQQVAEQTAALDAVHVRLRMNDRMATIGTLAAGLGHDMSNVLLPIRARINALRASGDSAGLSASQRAHVEDIQDSVAYLQQLADGLHFLALDPESPEASRGGGASTDLRAWWSQFGSLLSRAVPKHVRVTATFAPDLPRAAIAAHGLSQAMLNLIVNAGEAIPRSDGRRRHGVVRLHADAAKDGQGEWVRLTVKDNGTGMSEEVRRRAFDMFYTTKPRGLGTGLGLALVRRAAERVGGSAWIESAPGEGTTVTLLLPIHDAADRSAPGGKAPVALVSLRDGRATELMRQILEAWGAIARRDIGPERADIWVVSPAELDVGAARRWRTRHPQGRLVLAGAPAAHSKRLWKSIPSIVIEDPSDLDDVRGALGRAVSAGSPGVRTWKQR